MVLFEAGAIAKTVREKPLACTLLIDLQIAEVRGPLAQFQATKPSESELLHLVKTLNKALGESALEESQVVASFELCWPKLKEKIDTLPPDGSEKPPERGSEDMLNELVELARQTTTELADLSALVTAQLTRSSSRRLVNLSTLATPSYLEEVSGIIPPGLATVYDAPSIADAVQAPKPPDKSLGSLRAAAKAAAKAVADERKSQQESGE